MHFRTQRNLAPPRSQRRAQGVLFAAHSVNHAARGKVRSLDELHQLVHIDRVEPAPLPQHVDQRVANLAQIVRRDIGRHANGDARRAIDQHIGRHGRQDGGLAQRSVKVVDEINRLLVDVNQQLAPDIGHPRFRIAHGGRAVAINAAEVALPVYEHVAHREVLRHSNHGVVNGAVAVWMVLAQHFAHDSRAFLVPAARVHTHIVHGVENAPMHRLQPVARIGQRPRHDHAHRVTQVGVAHFAFNIDWLDRAISHEASLVSGPDAGTNVAPYENRQVCGPSIPCGLQCPIVECNLSGCQSNWRLLFTQARQMLGSRPLSRQAMRNQTTNLN